MAGGRGKRKVGHEEGSNLCNAHTGFNQEVNRDSVCTLEEETQSKARVEGEAIGYNNNKKNII